MSGTMLYAAIADDDTGASDLAGMFADQGMRPLLVLDASLLQDEGGWMERAEAVVLATAARAVAPADAHALTLRAVEHAARLRPRTVQIKYCSTFDSTEQGNIGPSLDAALGALGESFTIAAPALPVNGRTTCWGYHFVHGQLLSESPMSRHPLNPMTNANLVEHLGRQTPRKVGLTPASVVRAGARCIVDHWGELRAKGIEISIVDCLDERDGAALAEAACELRLISGSSLFGIHLPGVWRRRGWLGGESGSGWDDEARRAEGKGTLVVAGSCSPATAAQNAWIERRGARVFELPVRELVEGDTGEAKREARSALHAGATVLLKTQSTKEAIARAQAWGETQGWPAAELGRRISARLAALVKELVTEEPPALLLCAGGETSGAICRALGIRGFRVGRNIEPGVPLCYPIEGLAAPVVLKSGNFGSEGFYEAARLAAAGRARSRVTQ